MTAHLAVGGDVFDGILFCAVLFPQYVLDTFHGMDIQITIPPKKRLDKMFVNFFPA